MAKLFGGGAKQPKPTPMVDEAAVRKAKLAQVSKMRQSGGRESTILGSADKLGG